MKMPRGPVVFFAALAAVASPSFAQTSASYSSLALVAPFEKKQAVSLVVPAQVLAFQMQIHAAADEWENRLRDVEAARAQLADLAAKQGLRLRTAQGVVLAQGYGKLAFSSAGRTELDVKAGVLLLAEVDAKTDLVDVVRRVRLLTTRTALPKGVSLALGEARLGLEEPEKYRPELLKKIRAHLDATAGALGPNVELVVTGLDDAVHAQQFEERSVELSLPLRVSYTRKAL